MNGTDTGSIARRCAVVAAAILVVTGCTVESSGEGCSIVETGFKAGGSELGAGHFDYDDGEGFVEEPVAIGQGAEFTLTYRSWSLDERDHDVALRTASRLKLVQSHAGAPSSARFKALDPGFVAVLAVSSSEPSAVVDLVHLRVIAPSKVWMVPRGGVPSEIYDGLEKGKLTVPAGVKARFGAEARGEVDEANGPVGEAEVGALVRLRGIRPVWETTNPSVVSLDVQDDGTVVAHAASEGSADVTVSAGSVSETVEVIVSGRAR
jgi:hypothetical protein